MRNGFRVVSIYAGRKYDPKARVNFKTDSVQSLIGLTVYSPPNTGFTTTDSLGVSVSHGMGANSFITIDLDATQFNATLSLVGDNITNFRFHAPNATYSSVREIDILEEHSLNSLSNMANGSTGLLLFSSVDLPNVTDGSLAFRDTAITTFPDIDVSGMSDTSSMFYNAFELETVHADFTGITVDKSSMFVNANKIRWVNGLHVSGSASSSGALGFNNNSSSTITVDPNKWKIAKLDSPLGYDYNSNIDFNNSTFEMDFTTTGTGVIQLKPDLYYTSDITITDTTGSVTTINTTTNTTISIDNSGNGVCKIVGTEIKGLRFTTNNIVTTNIIKGGKIKTLSSFLTFNNTNYTSFSCNENLTLLENFSNAFRWAFNLISFESTNVMYQSLEDLSSTFVKCTGLQSFPTLVIPRVSKIISAWEDCTSLTTFPTIDLSSATSINNAWKRCTGLTSFPLIPIATDNGAPQATSMWENCSGLTTFPAINTSGWSSMTSTWKGCSGLTTFPSINTSACRAFSSTWKLCTSLTSFPVITLNNGGGNLVMSNTWQDCSNLTTIPSINFNQVTTMSNVFLNSGITSFVDAVSLNWSSATLINDVFKNCSNLANIGLLILPSVATFKNVFENCTSLTTFPNNLDLSNITSSCNLNWKGCTGLTTFPDIIIGNASTFNNNWQNCTGLTSFNDIDFSNVTGSINNNWEGCTGLTTTPNITTKVIPSAHSFSANFQNCTSLTTVTNLNLIAYNSINNCFQGCSALTSFGTITTPSSNFTAYRCFYACTNLVTAPNMDFNKVTNVSQLFEQCTSLVNASTIVNIGVGATIGTNSSRLFHTCNNITNVPIIDFTNFTALSDTFRNCSSLTNLPDMSTTGSVTNFSNTFNGCSSLVCISTGLNGTSSAVNNNPASVFGGCTSLTSPNATEQIDIIDNNVNWTNSSACP